MKQDFSEGAIDALKQRFYKMKELTPEQENYLEEQAREKYLEEKHKKGLVECKFCGFKYSPDISCPECERQLSEYDKEK